LAAKKHRKEEKRKLALAARKQDRALQIIDGDGTFSDGDKAFLLTSALKAQKHEMSRMNPNLDSSSSLPSITRDENTIRRGLLRQKSVHVDEVKMVEGALLMKTKTALDAYTPMREVFAISVDAVLDEAKIVEIYRRGFSRVPVFHKKPDAERDYSAICGILMTKQLIVVNASDRRAISTLPLNIPFCVPPSIDLVELTNWFQTGGSEVQGGHMAIVCARPEIADSALRNGEAIPEAAGVMGIITMEDVLENLIQEQIFDEMDGLDFEQARRARWAYKRWQKFVNRRKWQRQAKSDRATSMEEGSQNQGEADPLLPPNDSDRRKSLFGIL